MGNVFFRVGVFVCMPPGYSILRLEGFVSVLVCLFLKELKKSEYGMMCECVVGASWVVGRGSRVRVLRNVEINFFLFSYDSFSIIPIFSCRSVRSFFVLCGDEVAHFFLLQN